MILMDVLRDICEKLWFKNAKTPENGMNIPLSIILALVITGGVAIAFYFYQPNNVIWISVASFVITFLSFRWTNIIIAIAYAITGLVGYGFGIYNFFG